MHELSLCESILNSLQESAREHKFERVKRVVLEIGKLSTVEIEAMRFAFDAVKRSTLAEDAQLEIVELPGRARCLTCNIETQVEQRFDPCPKCGEFDLQLIQGDELKIKELEVD